MKKAFFMFFGFVLSVVLIMSSCAPSVCSEYVEANETPENTENENTENENAENGLVENDVLCIEDFCDKIDEKIIKTTRGDFYIKNGCYQNGDKIIFNPYLWQQKVENYVIKQETVSSYYYLGKILENGNYLFCFQHSSGAYMEFEFDKDLKNCHFRYFETYDNWYDVQKIRYLFADEIINFV